MSVGTGIARAGVAALLAAGCGRGALSSEPPPAPEQPRNPAAVVEGEPYRPAIDPSDFVDVIDNPYLPLRPGTTLVYEGVSDGEREVVKTSVTGATKEVVGVTTTVVRDRAFVDGGLVEDTFDWFAQDRHGNVWYFGEDTRELENGRIVSTKGSWEAGVDGAQPGIAMLADPRVGDEYRQEFYEGEAEDMARVLRLDESVTVPHGSFHGVLVTEDWTPLEPKVLENKLYARGVGVVLERLVRGGEEVLRLVEVSRSR
jgi:hypothetical protein